MTIESAFKDLGSFFYSNEKFANQVSGKLFPKNNSVLNIYTKGGNGVIEYPYKQEDLESLYQFASEARFGRQNEDVLDPTYRKAKTLTNDLFAMNLMPGSGTLQEINRVIGGNFTGEYMLEAELYRLNIYKEGDFFREHMDTPQTEQSGHIGSLVMFLPTEYEGGELVINNSSLDDHTTYAFGQEKGGGVNWVAFFPDAEHSVLPVTSGYRLTLTFHLYQQKVPGISTAPSYHGQNPVIQKVRSIMQDGEQAEIFWDQYVSL